MTDWSSWREDTIAAVVAACPDKCGTGGWRGRFCSYHEGFIDGLDAALAQVVTTDVG